MPRTIDSLVASHAAATARRARGLSAWAHTVDVSDVFHDNTLSFPERRDGIVAILRRSRWAQAADEFDFLTEVIDNLADADTVEEFDDWWDALYDQADRDRVWIATTTAAH